MKSILITGLFLCSLSLLAQDKLKLVNSGKLIKEGIEYHDQKLYDKAILKYKQIPENDTNYHLALYEMGLSYSAQESYPLAIEVLKKAIELETSTKASYYQQLGNAYSMNKQLEKSLEIYRQGLRIFPYYFRFYSEMGVACAENGQSAMGIKYLDTCLQINFTYGRAHFLMGQLCERNNYFIPAILSYQMAAYLSPEGGIGLDALLQIQKIAKGEIIVNKDSIIKLFPDDENVFEDIDDIIRSKSELSPKYKVKPAVNLPFEAIIKSLHLVNNRLSLNPEGKGWYYENLVPLYIEWWNKKEFATIMYRICNSAQNEATTKMYKKNKAKIDKQFSDFFNETVEKRMVYKSRDPNLKGKFKHIFTYVNNNLYMLIPAEYDYDFNKALSGHSGFFRYYYNNGEIKSEGDYENGNLKGKWIYYNEDGTLKSWVDNVSATEYTLTRFYKNGQKRWFEHLKDEKNINQYISYYPNGVKEQLIPLKNGLVEGKFELYHDNGQLSRSNTIIKEKLADGEEINYYPNGKISKKINYKNGKLEGDYTEFYVDGILETITKYKDGKANGICKEYHRNGKLRAEYNYLDGEYDGTYKKYHENGILAAEANYTKGENKGKSKYFDIDGKLYAEYLESKGKIKTAAYFDKAGKVIYEVDAQKNELFIKKYNEVGILIEEGKVKKDFRVGLWKFYTESGALMFTKTYDEKGEFTGKVEKFLVGEVLDERYELKNGKLEGYYVEFFLNGNKLREGNYVNDEKEGPWKWYYANKNLKEESFFTQGKITGLRRYYHPDGKLELIEEYKEGLIYKMMLFNKNEEMISMDTTSFPRGNILLKYENGNPYCSLNYLNGKKNGKQITYYNNGKHWIIEEYKDGDQINNEYCYHPNGKLKYKCKYVDDELDSIYNTYNEDGILESTEVYKYGKSLGEEKYYYPNGKVELKINNLNGDREGWVDYFSMDGTFQYKIYYHLGIEIAYSYKDKTGKFIDSIPFKNASGDFTTYFQNGNLSAKGTLLNGSRIGTYLKYHSNGKKALEMGNKSGYKHGLYTEYYENGNIITQVNYDNGYKLGIEKEYDSQGKLIRETNWDYGFINGPRKYYANGKLINTLNYYYDNIVE